MAGRAKPPLAALVVRPSTRSEALRYESPGRLRGPAYERPTRGVVVGVDPTERTTRGYGHRLAVFRTALGRRAVFGGASAAWALGACLAAETDPVEVVYQPQDRSRGRPGLRVRGDLLLPGEVVDSEFGLVTGPARTAFDLARRPFPGTALAWVDAVSRATGIGPDQLGQTLDAHPGVRGVRQARTVLALADGRAESPRESVLRWELFDAGLPAPVPQYVVLDGTGGFVARLDLAWPARRVGAEYDGDHHREPDQHRHDLERHNRLRALGWVVVQVDAAQLRDAPRLAALLRRTLERPR